MINPKQRSCQTSTILLGPFFDFLGTSAHTNYELGHDMQQRFASAVHASGDGRFLAYHGLELFQHAYSDDIEAHLLSV